jgi:hypothetical protein
MVVEATIKKPTIKEEEPMPKDISGFKFKSAQNDDPGISPEQSTPVLIPLAQRQTRNQLQMKPDLPIFDERLHRIVYPFQPQNTVWKLDGVDHEEISDFLGMKI